MKYIKIIIRKYYLTFKKKQVYKCLKIFYDYQDIKEGINIDLAIELLSKEPGYNLLKAKKAYKQMQYLGFIKRTYKVKPLINVVFKNNIDEKSN